MKSIYDDFKRLRPKTQVAIIGAVVLILIGLVSTAARANSFALSFAWDAVEYPAPIVYQLGSGPDSRAYDAFIDIPGDQTTGRVEQLAPMGTYYFAVRACTADHSHCSGWSNELSITLPAYEIVDPQQFRDIDIEWWNKRRDSYATWRRQSWEPRAIPRNTSAC